MGVLHFGYDRDNPMGSSESFESHYDLTNGISIFVIYVNILRLFQIAGFSYEVAKAVMSIDYDEALKASGLFLPTSEEFKSATVDNQGHLHYHPDAEDHQNEKPSEPSKPSAEDVQRAVTIERMIENPERMKNWLKQIQDNPDLAKDVFRAYLKDMMMGE